MGQQLGLDAVGGRGRADGGQQGARALGPGGIGHFQGRGRADAVVDDVGDQEAAVEQGQCGSGLRARQMQVGAASLPGGPADDPAIDQGGSTGERLNGGHGGRRDGVAVDVETREPGGEHGLGDVQGGMRRTDRGDRVAGDDLGQSGNFN